MSNMNCRNVRREIEEVGAGDLLSSSASDHLKDCTQCVTFREERRKLREMLSSLGAVEAPGDFDFRLRARLANEKRGGAQPFVMRNLSFGFRSAAFASILLLIGSAFLFVRYGGGPPDSSLSNATKSPSVTIDNPAMTQPGKLGSESANAVAIGPQIDRPSEGATNLQSVPVSQQRTNRRAESSKGVASLRDESRLKTRELSSTPAPVLRPTDGTATNGPSVFPIGTSFQSLKVSVDDGRGSSRTISLPSVSFGSQRVLAQGSSPLVASARTDW